MFNFIKRSSWWGIKLKNGRRERERTYYLMSKVVSFWTMTLVYPLDMFGIKGYLVRGDGGYVVSTRWQWHGAWVLVGELMEELSPSRLRIEHEWPLEIKILSYIPYQVQNVNEWRPTIHKLSSNSILRVCLANLKHIMHPYMNLKEVNFGSFFWIAF